MIQMAMNRYLLHVSYIGTSFCGAQRQVTGAFPRANDPSTVQGQLEMGLKQLNPCNEPVVYLSSRTDAGVHALNSTCHVDLFRRNGMQYEPRTLTICLNKHFTKQEVPIRVLKTFLIPEDFHSRHRAESRTYLYRLAIVKADALNVAPHLHLLPVEELQRCLFICTDTFDINEMKRASKLFEGLHDFRTFMARGSKDPDKMTRRVVNRVEIIEGKPLTSCSYSWPSFMCPSREDYQYYDVYVQASGFLYRQK
ncbi:tRNA pseudouridine synthase-like 1 isoform X3 [Tenebrio molitor]|uniref:tRNA pseudouridine synthase-like 1 isoform X3 n=1 Tax=Tenebrio molitor TaxID=7067 RepID=UPI00362488BF